MVKIEFLFPEVANLYGDPFNIKYLKNSMKNVEVIETSLTNKPYFVDQDVDMIYMGSMSERTQKIVIEKLKPYKERIEQLINGNKVILLTGNAFEVFGKYIEEDDGKRVEGLGIVDTYAKIDLKNRYNTLFLGELNDDEKIKIVGYKATFSFSFGDNEKNYAFKSIRGCGINKESQLEGIRINNLFGTYLIGPLLIMNPDFTKYLIELLGEKPELQFEEEALECYNKRLKEFEKESTNYLQ